MKSDEVIARVVKNSPAAQAGIRDGDVLLRVDKYDFTNWRTNDTGLFAFWQWPAGTKFTVRLMRNRQPIETAVVLRDILVPQTKPSPSP
jgi:S1-C subfamily serine protease